MKYEAAIKGEHGQLITTVTADNEGGAIQAGLDKYMTWIGDDVDISKLDIEIIPESEWWFRDGSTCYEC